MRNVTVAATQMSCSWNIESNMERAERLVREAAAQGAQIILLQELFETPYFCQDIDEGFKELAQEMGSSVLLNRFAALATELNVVLPVSFYERSGDQLFNSIAIIDANGEIKNRYRKTHIPDTPGYHEDHYFSPGDTGFMVTQTQYGKIGVGICWDQWFPEAARSMALMGAELIFYPTAIGSEPSDPDLDSRDHWQRVMQGHAAANLVPVIASNRVGVEMGRSTQITFYGSSFICNEYGAITDMADRYTEGVLVATFDLDVVKQNRDQWGIFHTRQPERYAEVTASIRPEHQKMSAQA